LVIVIKLKARAASRKIINSHAMNRQIKDATKNKKTTETYLQYCLRTFSAELSPSAGGEIDNSPRFKPWVNRTKMPKPRRGDRKYCAQDSFVPAGLGMLVSIPPAVETAGYFRSPLCGWKQKRRSILNAF
jgi:hypothetical protein